MEIKHILMLLGVVALIIAPLIIYQGLGEDEGYFTGTDSNAGNVIKETGYQPGLQPIWEPPSGEIESLIFALQAAIGAFIIGYFLGYYRQKQKKSANDD